MINLTIEPKSEGKGRAFRSILMASVEADSLWEAGGNSDNQRPVWAMFTGSENELKAFMANLSTGRYASYPHKSYGRNKEDRLELLKTAGYRTVWQREEEGTIATVFLPDFFMIDPGMVNPEGVKFILLPTQKWISGQRIPSSKLKEHVLKCGHDITGLNWKRTATMAFLFAAYLDRRTRCPLVADGRFFVQLMLTCLNKGLASFASTESYREDFGVHRHLRYWEHGVEDVGLVPGVVFNAKHDVLEALLAEEVDTYFSHI